MWELISAIPKQALAKAAVKCQAHARALMYFESHLRYIPGGGALNKAANTQVVFEDHDVSFLGEIYSGLQEPDGLMGLSYLRQVHTINDNVLMAEQEGRWADALTLHEKALRLPQTETTSGPSGGRGGGGSEGAGGRGGSSSAGGVEGGGGERGHLRCLLSWGQWETVLRQVDGLSGRYGRAKTLKHATDLRTYGVAAAWRLGQWDALDDHLDASSSTAPGGFWVLGYFRVLQDWSMYGFAF
jgi:serine/threonine-protein kinase ATR